MPVGKRKRPFSITGPDGGFHTGYDQTGTYAGTQENAETTSIVIMALSGLSTTSPFPLFSIPAWIIHLYTGLAAAAATVVITVLVLEERKRKQHGRVTP